MLTVKVTLWSKNVGALLEEENGRISFQFDPEFLKWIHQVYGV